VKFQRGARALERGELDISWRCHGN
jgi:hypothetical protein